MSLASLLLAVVCATPSGGIGVVPGADNTALEYADRGINLGQGDFRLDLAPRDFGLFFGGIGGHGETQDVAGLRIGRNVVGGRSEDRIDDTLLRLTLGAGFGITDQLEVGGTVMPLYIAPDGDFGDIELYGRYALMQTKSTEVGVQLTVAMPTDTVLGIGAGAPILLRLGRLRIDTGVEVEVLFTEDVLVDLDVPFAVSVNVGDGLFAGLRSGIFAPQVKDVAVPLMAHLGYTLMSGKTPFIDLVGSFGWSRFLWSGPGDTINLRSFDLIVGARLFFSVN